MDTTQVSATSPGRCARPPSPAPQPCVTVVACGEPARDHLVASYHQRFPGRRARDVSCVWSGLVLARNDRYPEARYEHISHVYDEELIETACRGGDAIALLRLQVN